MLTAPTAPSSLMIVNITNTTVTLLWIPPNTLNGIVTHYQIQYWRSNSNTNIISLNTTSADLSYRVTGLTSDTEYVFRVRSFTVVGHGPFSNEVTTLTSKLLHKSHTLICK